VVSRERLLQIIDPNSELFERTIDRILCRLRQKLDSAGANAIQLSSIYGVGYRLERTR
jgi:DNA-binding response OmpR family regulator